MSSTTFKSYPHACCMTTITLESKITQILQILARQRQQNINGNTLCLYEPLIFDPPQIRRPLTDCQKIGHRWLGLRWRQLPLNQIWCKSVHRPRGGFWANMWNITKNYLYPLFGNSPTGQTDVQIFALDGSNDAVLRKDVPFQGSLTLLFI